MSRIHYPITSLVVEHGHTTEYQLHENDVVECYYCKSHFPVKGNVIIPDIYDNKALKCPECGKVVSVLYYYDRKVKV